GGAGLKRAAPPLGGAAAAPSASADALDVGADVLILGVGEEIVGEALAGDGGLEQVLVDGLQDRQHVLAAGGLQVLQDAAVLGHDLGPFLGIARAALVLEQLAIAVLQVQFGRPAETL